jgi:hypothetical protein
MRSLQRCALLFLFCCATTLAEDVSWTKTVWNGEPAWTAACRGWTAVVSERRARLVSFGPGETNLLFAPSSVEGASTWGGHRSWLGPQREWDPDWPPPADWESASADEVTVREDVLEVKHKRTDPRYPAVRRTYKWTASGDFSAETEWRDDVARRFSSVQVFQFPLASSFQIPAEKTKQLPEGLALLGGHPRYDLSFAFAMPPTLRWIGDHVRIDGEKSGSPLKPVFRPAPIEIVTGGHKLELLRGKITGTPSEELDAGLYTQVWIGDAGFPVMEAEQLSPRLEPDQSGKCAFEVLLRPARGDR